MILTAIKPRRRNFGEFRAQRRQTPARSASKGLSARLYLERLEDRTLL
jgi:hypothetical protein